MHSVSWDEARKTAMLFVLRSDQGEEKNPILFCALATSIKVRERKDKARLHQAYTRRGRRGENILCKSLIFANGNTGPSRCSSDLISYKLNE